MPKKRKLIGEEALAPLPAPAQADEAQAEAVAPAETVEVPAEPSPFEACSASWASIQSLRDRVKLLEAELADLRKEIGQRLEGWRKARTSLPLAQAALLGATVSAGTVASREGVTVRVFADGSALWEERREGQAPARTAMSRDEAREAWRQRFPARPSEA